MADLRELEKFENNLKKLIEERNQPITYTGGKIYDDDDELTNQTFMIVEEHGQPYKPTKRTGISESIRRRQPFTVNIEYERRGGRAYILPEGMVTKMAVREHGQPYKATINFDEQGRPYIAPHQFRKEIDTKVYIDKPKSDYRAYIIN